MAPAISKTATTERIKMRLRKGDTVQVIAGKDKGKTGEVLRTLPNENRVIVQGINLRTRHVKPTQEGETGRILTEEASLHASNVMFYSTEKKLASRIELITEKDGSKKRRLKKTGEVID
ncbi:MAG: 50S ribosomal protein L24 [Synechococcus sp. NP17]|jgi:large subunit ribosomal protein L24|nr:50S ribosomal protein L24 [Synechococcus sp. NP17]|tara:strand:+ start:447 stop:803 length:357 start_codon:yes stop_codon:yes gene_type:complete